MTAGYLIETLRDSHRSWTRRRKEIFHISLGHIGARARFIWNQKIKEKKEWSGHDDCVLHHVKRWARSKLFVCTGTDSSEVSQLPSDYIVGK